MATSGSGGGDSKKQRTQAHREFAVATPLGEDKLLFRRMKAVERLGRPFEIDLEMITETKGLKTEDLLGKNVTVRVNLPKSKVRYLNGVVASVRREALGQGVEVWFAHVVPWLWFLTRRSDCRIFQEKSVPEIIKEVFRLAGASDFDDKLTASYAKREYCVQYRETHFDFVSRLMEEEGIYYHFKHEDGKHTLVLEDDSSAHEPVAGYESIPFRDVSKPTKETDWIETLRLERGIQAGRYVLTDYDYLLPNKQLESVATVSRQHDHADGALFDHPGGFTEVKDGDRYASVRLDERHTGYEVFTGRSTCRSIACGTTFTLTDHPISDYNAKLLVSRTSITAELDDFGYGFSELAGRATSGQDSLEVSFEAIPAAQQFRPQRVTPAPTVPGPQTAFVVGPSGQEIHTDEHGRIKVMFHWDRAAPADGTDSCWMRVSQPTAGRGWGGISIPRVGHEVIVEFLDGDPDRPIVTGRVYNGKNTVPYDLPRFKTITTFKSNSSPGGGGFNELRFEDKKDEEQVYLYAERNLDIHVKNDRYETVMHDRHLVVENNRHEHVKNESHLQVDKDVFTQVGGDSNTTVKGKQAWQVEKDSTLMVGKDLAEEIKGGMSTIVAKDLYIKAKNIVIEGETNVTVKVGSSSIAFDSSGCGITAPEIKADAETNITQTAGANFSMEATGNLSAKATGDATVEGLNATVKGDLAATVEATTVEVSGNAQAAVKGGITMIG